MCDYCQAEGCFHGEDGSSYCQCATIGTQTCPGCGCESEPWWRGIKFPGSQEVGGLENLMLDQSGDSSFFPVNKAKLVQTLSEDYSAPDEAQWLAQNLPDRTYKDTGEIVSSLVAHLSPIKWERKTNDLLWKYPCQVIAVGQQLQVDENQEAVLMAKDGTACDTFSKGSYVISQANCPLLKEHSRKALPGYEKTVLDGWPVFVYASMEFEVDFSVMGETRALRRVMAKGVARVRISSSPKLFLEQVAAKSNFNTEGTLSTLRKYCTELLKKEMSARELDELKNSAPALEKAMTEGFEKMGIEALNIKFDSIGEFGPGMFMPSPSLMNDPKKMAEMRQMAESMRASQMAQIEAMKAAQLQRTQLLSNTQVPPQQQRTPPQQIRCPDCGLQNSAANKFCNNCGKPLQPKKKVCPKCGQQSDSSITFCGNCGTKLS